MGKLQQLPLQGQKDHQETTGSGADSNSTLFGEGCVFCCSKISKEFNLKCMFTVLLSLAVFISAVFWIVPLRHKHYGFEAKAAIKHRAIVQAYFELEKPVASIITHINELEYAIFSEIGVPYSKAAVLSMHEGSASNRTAVTIGFLPEPNNVSMDVVSLSLLKASLLGLFMDEFNLTLTKSLGQTLSSSFQILKCPMGITMIPEEYTTYWRIPQILFKFTMNNSIYETKENLYQLKQQLRLSLLLRPYENVYLQVTNMNGSTIDPPVTVNASITSDLNDGPSLQRLKQLARRIRYYSHSKNLGLDDTVFGKVKEISLSSFVNHSIHAMPPCSNCHAHSPSSPRRRHHHRHHHHHHVHRSRSNHAIAPSPSNPFSMNPVHTPSSSPRNSPGPRQEKVYPIEGPVSAPSVSYHPDGASVSKWAP